MLNDMDDWMAWEQRSGVTHVKCCARPNLDSVCGGSLRMERQPEGIFTLAKKNAISHIVINGLCRACRRGKEQGNTQITLWDDVQ